MKETTDTFFSCFFLTQAYVIAAFLQEVQIKKELEIVISFYSLLPPPPF